MKFLAILMDSVREAIDFKVFYVMIGLSLVLAVLTLSLGFTVEPGAKKTVRQYAILGLNEDTASLDQSAVRNMFVRDRPVEFSVRSVKPVGGNDSPSGTFHVVLQASYKKADDVQYAEDHPDELVQFIRERFGLVEHRLMMRASNVRVKNWEGYKLFLLGRNVGGHKAILELTAEAVPATIRFWPHKCTFLFGAVALPASQPLFEQVLFIESIIVGWMGSNIAVIVSIIITAFFIPNMLRKGTIDLLLVKPIHRPVLLLYKYIGGLTFIFLNTTVAVGCVWLALGLRSGLWAPTFLLMIFVLTFFFAVLYAVSALFGVLTRSPIASILLTVVFWVLLTSVTGLNAFFELRRGMDRVARALDQSEASGKDAAAAGAIFMQNTPFSRAAWASYVLSPPPAPVDVPVATPEEGESEEENRPPRPGRRRGPLEELHFEENWVSRGTAALHASLPRTSDLDQFLNKHLRHDLAFGELLSPPVEQPAPELPGALGSIQFVPEPAPLWLILGVSLSYIVAFLGLASWRFAVRDY
jgi:ABC-type transport system involved in multi-copper enzyme maturation permease subunit